jgi:hypothetical protein
VTWSKLDSGLKFWAATIHCHQCDSQITITLKLVKGLSFCKFDGDLKEKAPIIVGFRQV